jgi:2-oxoglutarate ferredoxin oxidoreductase subunit alpha
MLLQGNEACVEGALYAGCRFFAGYPITPSSEIAETMAEKLPQLGGAFIQMEDEIASMAAVIGASMCGLKVLTATSGPGFSLKQENLGYACYVEVPCVVVNVQRGGPSTGAPTGPGQADIMQARWGTHGDHPIIAVCPASVQECFTETVRAFNLAEKYRCPAIVLTDEIVGHMREKLVVPEPGELEVIDRVKPSCPPKEYLPFDLKAGDIPPLAAYGEGYRFHVTGLDHREDGFPTQDPEMITRQSERKMRKIYQNKKDIVKVEMVDANDAEVGVIAFGATSRSAKLAVRLARQQGIRAGLLRLLTIWPFADEEVYALASQADRLVVPEMNLGQLSLEVERAAQGKAKVAGVYRVDREPISPDEILQAIKGD